MSLAPLALVTVLALTAGVVERRQMPAPSLGDRSRTVRVYLPPSYSRPEAATRRYPVIYLLHGWPGSDGNWFGMGHAAQVADSMIARGEIPEVILVCPNGNPGGPLSRSLYVNSYDGRFRMEDYLTLDLLTWTDSTFRTRASPAARAAIGLSDGATGAFNLAFRHPGLFGACGGHSGHYRLQKGFGTGAMLGPEPGASRLLEAHSPLLTAAHLVPQLRQQVIYFDCGTSDEDLEDNRALDRRLTALGVPHTYREFPGSHTWGYWQTHLHDSLRALTARMR